MTRPRKPVVEEAIGLSVRQLDVSKGGNRVYLTPPVVEGGGSLATFDFQAIEVDWETYPLRNSRGGGPEGGQGQRSWFFCPTCRARRLKLYWWPCGPNQGSWKCRTCHGLKYLTQRQTRWTRLVAKEQKLYAACLGGRPKWKHRAKHYRGVTELRNVSLALNLSMIARARPARINPQST